MVRRGAAFVVFLLFVFAGASLVYADEAKENFFQKWIREVKASTQQLKEKIQGKAPAVSDKKSGISSPVSGAGTHGGTGAVHGLPPRPPVIPRNTNIPRATKPPVRPAGVSTPARPPYIPGHRLVGAQKTNGAGTPAAVNPSSPVGRALEQDQARVRMQEEKEALEKKKRERQAQLDKENAAAGVKEAPQPVKDNGAMGAKEAVQPVKDNIVVGTKERPQQ